MNDDKVVEVDVRKSVQFNAVLKEAKVAEENWSDKIESVKNITDNYKRSCVCLLLENQRLMNECAIDSVQNIQDLKKKMLDMVSAVFPNLLAWNLISIQPMIGPTGLVYGSHHVFDSVTNTPTLCIDSEDIVARTRMCKRFVHDDFGPKDVAKDLIDEFDTEILNDVWNNCAVVGCVNLKSYTVDKAVRLREYLEETLEQAAKKLNNYEPNWMVVNDKLYNRLKPAFDSIERISIYPHKSVKGILMGRRGDSYMDSGYVYSPYVPFTFTPLAASGTFGMLTRYGKKLLRNGSFYYSRVSVLDDVPEQE